MNTNTVEEISNKIREIIEKSPKADLERNLNALFQGAFTKMGLVSREEFDVQTEVLRKTREKLVQLEAKLDELSKTS